MSLIEKPIAHRGLWNESVPENSLLAFERAVERGYPIELDVQMIADGSLVIFHDWTLERMTDKHGKLSIKKWNEISGAHLLETQCTIPKLKDVLRVVDGKVPVIIEIKNRDHNRSDFIKNLSEAVQSYRGNYALSSFDPFLVKMAKEKCGDVACGQNFADYSYKGLFRGWIQKNIMYFLWILSKSDPDFFVCESVLLPQCWIARVAKKRNKPLLTWGLKNEKEYAQKKSSIDNYIFDNETYE